MTDCPECGTELTPVADHEAGEIIDCPTCGTELEVVEPDPLVVEPAPELQEDWGE